MTSRACVPAPCVVNPRRLLRRPNTSSNLAGHLAAGGRVILMRARLPGFVQARDAHEFVVFETVGALVLVGRARPARPDQAMPGLTQP